MTRQQADMVRALHMTLELFETGVALMRQNLRRRHPTVSDAEIDAMLDRWMVERPGARHGDSAGQPRLTPA